MSLRATSVCLLHTTRDGDYDSAGRKACGYMRSFPFEIKALACWLQWNVTQVHPRNPTRLLERAQTLINVWEEMAFVSLVSGAGNILPSWKQWCNSFCLLLLPSLGAFFSFFEASKTKPFWLSDKHRPNRFFFSQRENIFALSLDPEVSVTLQPMAMLLQPVCCCW